MRQLVLLDIDGTLLIGAGSGRAATDLAMREVFGTSGQLHSYPFGGKTDYYTLVQLLTPEGFTEAQITALLPHYSEVVTRHMQQIVGNFQIRALPGAVDLVKALASRDDVLLGLLTGNVAPMADLKLRLTGFDPSVFRVAVYGTEARIRRDLVPIALSRAEQHTSTRFDPANVVIVGDTVDDIDCAHSINARIVAVATGNSPRAELEQHPPVDVLDNFQDVDATLRLILALHDF